MSSVGQNCCCMTSVKWRCFLKSIGILLESLSFNGYKINLIQLNITDQ